ncbi:MAG: winged helix-turn-helix domain-containing protein [Rhodospirillales bacterium]
MDSKLDEALPLADRATLNILSAIEEDVEHSQRSLTKRIGIALGLTNSLLKRAARKGYIKIRQVPAKRFAYYVTPKGFAEKSRLVSEYLRSSLRFFRNARIQYESVFADVAAAGYERVVLFGTSELAEIASLSVHESGLTIAGIVQPGANTPTFAGLKVLGRIEDVIDMPDTAVVITDASAPQSAFDLLSEKLDRERLFAPGLLYIRMAKEAA